MAHTVMVTGADGFIGSHLTEELVKRGEKVRAFCLYNSFGSLGWIDTLPPEIRSEIDIFMGDVRDPNGVRTAMRGQERVFHLAALIAIPFSYHSPDSYVDTNIKGTLNVLNAARELDTQRALVTSTSEVYGTAQYVPIDEKHPFQGQSPYSATKIGADRLAESFYRSFDLPVTIVRPFNTYGPRQSGRAIIPTIITQLLAGQTEIKLGSLTPTRDFNYVKDTANGFMTIADCDAAIGQELIRCVNLFAPDYGLDVVAEVDYSSNATDLSSQVLALKQADPDAILCDSYIGDATLFVQTLKEQNYKPKMIVAKANGFTDPSFIPNLGASANGVASVVEFNPDLTNGVEINEDFKKVYNVNMNGHSAESYTVVWLFKTAIEKAGSTDGAAVRDALAELSIDGAFEGGRKIVLPYSKIEFSPEYEIGGVKHYRDNTYASVAIAQVQDQDWKTVWPFEFASSKIQEVTLG